MEIYFDDYDKKFKSSLLKELENSVKILKNIFDEILINNEGIVYHLDNKLNNGRVYAKTTLHKIFNIPEDSLLNLDLNKMSECLKVGKSKLIGFSIENNNLIFKTAELDYIVGELREGKKLNTMYIEDIVSKTNYRCSLNNLIERFNNKEFINIKCDKYDLILTHKLFPMVNKSVNFEFEAKDNDNGSFYGVFRNLIEERNKKDEITFSIEIVYLYRFLDLN